MWIVCITVSLLVLGCPVEAGGNLEMMGHDIEREAKSEASDIGDPWRRAFALLHPQKIRKRATIYKPDIKVPLRKKRSKAKYIRKRSAVNQPNMKSPLRKKRSSTSGESDVIFTFVNNCAQDLWIGAEGQSKSNPNCVFKNITFFVPNKGGWYLPKGDTSQVSVPFDFKAGRFWARTGCTGTPNHTFHCETGDCGPWIDCASGEIPRGGEPPITLAEFTLNENNVDNYAISLIVGFNIAMKINAITIDNSQPNKEPYWCYSPECLYDINSICPPEFAVNGSNGTVACKSACMKFNTDEYCCRSPCCGSPETCTPGNWTLNYANVPFKYHCPLAYSYAYDEMTSNFFCSNSNYEISFC